MKVSIAMATYNGSKWIEEQLDSFARQELPPDELVICDDCSKDETISIVERFRRRASFEIRVVSNEINSGHIKSFLRAMADCSGDLIFLSDQDDVWHRNKILAMTRLASAMPRHHVFLNDAAYADANGAPYGLTVLKQCINVGSGADGHIAGACTAVTREFADFIRPENFVDMPKYHDVYLHRWGKALRCRHTCNEILQVWRIHEGNSSVETKMANPEPMSLATWRAKFKGVDPRTDYLNKAAQFRKMRAHLRVRRIEFGRLNVSVGFDDVDFELSRNIEALENRAALREMSYTGRLAAIADMALRGKYKYFYGWKSIAKDLMI
ncbi:glycosyltransferase [Methylosinus sp. Ce-a6]|uniref:glycosyltransferase n=1 Tax=Methylosinus sp. Ce-a6 TaxID=2172005 RepID=UPI00135CE3B9|nr:glycosyltransferase [Methylosinus sp. Ce-a6]